ncbi:MAG: SURF1 family protein [Actinomycetota bacterium]
MRHFLTRRWITIHLMTLVIVAVCLSMASWQLGRLQDRKADNARLDSQTGLQPTDLAVLLPQARAAGSDVESAEFRRVLARGTFDPDEQVILQSRSLDRRQGNHLLTPLILESGAAILVDRGWVPLPTDDRVLAESQAPSGPVTAAGVLLPSEKKGLLGVSDPPPGDVTATPRVDLDRLAEQFPYPLYPVYLRMLSQEPTNPGELPRPAPIPEPSEGPHREYAVQWALFAGTALVIYLGLIRRDISRRRAGEREAQLQDATPAG